MRVGAGAGLEPDPTRPAVAMSVKAKSSERRLMRSIRTIRQAEGDARKVRA